MCRVRHNVRLAALFMGGVSAVICGCGQTPDATSGREAASPPASTASRPADLASPQAAPATPTEAPPLAQLTLDTLFPEDRVREVLSGHLCRCTGYTPIVRAVLDAATRLAGGATGQNPRNEDV